MSLPHGFKCVISGTGMLAIQCAEYLLKSNCSIQAVVGADTSFKEWAREHQILELLSSDSFALPKSYLFNINGVPLEGSLKFWPTVYLREDLATDEPLRTGAWCTPGQNGHELVLEFFSAEVNPNESAFIKEGKFMAAAHESFVRVIEALSHNSTPAESSSNNPRDWFYLPTWRQAPLQNIFEDIGPVLIFSNSRSFAYECSGKLLHNEKTIIKAFPGHHYQIVQEGEYNLDFTSEQDCRTLIKKIIAKKLYPETICLLLEPETADPRMFTSLLHQLCANLDKEREVRILLYGPICHHVNPDDHIDDPLAELLAFLGQIPRHYPHLVPSSIDADLLELRPRLLYRELTTEVWEHKVAWRNRKRLVPHWEHIRLDTKHLTLEDGGTYLLPYGPNGIALAQGFAEKAKVSLVLVQLDPERERNYNSLSFLPSEVIAYSLPQVSQEELSAMFSEVNEKLGNIKGMVLSPNLLGNDPEKIAKNIHLWQKQLVLEELDFLACCAYANCKTISQGVARCLLDQLANDWTKAGKKAFSIHWENWSDLDRVQSGIGYLDSYQLNEDEFHPLFTGWGECGGKYYYHCSIHPDHWIVAEHLYQGKPTLPATAFLQLIQIAFQHLHQASCIFKNIKLGPQCSLSSQQASVFVIQFHPNEKGYNICVTSNSEDPIAYIEGQISSLENLNADEQLDLDDFEVMSWERVAFISGKRKKRPFSNTFGPRYNCLRCIRTLSHLGFADLMLHDRFSNDLESFKMHPALFDEAIGFMIRDLGHDFLAESFGSIIFYGTLPQQLHSLVKLTSTQEWSSDTISYDVRVTDQQGNLVLEIRDYCLRRSTAPDLGSGAFRLQQLEAGIPETFFFEPIERRNLAADEVEIEVLSAGLASTDRLRALEDIHNPEELGFGSECSGRITAYGKEVMGLSIGDEVIALSTQSCATHIVVSAREIYKKPRNLTFDEAASILYPYQLAWFALVGLAECKENEVLLIHEADGSFALAALEIAQKYDLQVILMVEQQKPPISTAAKVTQIMCEQLKDTVEQITKGNGLNLVYSGRHGRQRELDLRLLAPGGHYLDIDRRDCLDNHALCLSNLTGSIHYHLVEFNFRHPAAAQAHEQLSELLAQRYISALPLKTFILEDVALAFHHLSKENHNERTILSFKDRSSIKIGKPTAHRDEDEVTGLTTEEGVDAFFRVLSSLHPRILVSRGVPSHQTANFHEHDDTRDDEPRQISESDKSNSSLIEFQKGNPQEPPLILIHPFGGQAFLYRKFLMYLDPNIPVYAFRAQGLYEGEEALKSIEDIALSYIDDLPKGLKKVYLGGFSFGGAVAYEMARLLRNNNISVPTILMLNTPAPGLPPMDLTNFGSALAYHLIAAGEKEISPNELIHMSTPELYRFYSNRPRSFFSSIPDTDILHFHCYLNVLMHNGLALKQYKPRPWSGELLFFKPKTRDLVTAPNSDRTWRNLINGPFQLFDVPGRHIAMCEGESLSVICQTIMNHLYNK